MDKYLIFFLLTFFLPNIYAFTEWSTWPFAFPCQEGLCVPLDRYACPCWHFQHACRPSKGFSCCEDPNFFPMPNMKSFVCENKTIAKNPDKKKP